jgi:orotate phosphoribosyltransferase
MWLGTKGRVGWLAGRNGAKEYGTRRLAEGLDVASTSVTLVEDVLTTRGAAREATLALRALGATASMAVCAIDRSGQPRGERT